MSVSVRIRQCEKHGMKKKTTILKFVPSELRKQEAPRMAWIPHLVKVCLSRAINLTRSCPKILTWEDFCRTYHRDHFSNWKFPSTYYSFQDIGWKLYKKKTKKKQKKNKTSFIFQGQYLWQGVIWQLWFLKTFEGLIIRIISATARVWLNIMVFGDICNKLLSDPYILFLVISTNQKSLHQFYVGYLKEHSYQVCSKW